MPETIAYPERINKIATASNVNTEALSQKLCKTTRNSTIMDTIHHARIRRTF